VDVLFIASVAVVAADPAKSRKVYADALGLPLEAAGDGEYSSERIEGSKHFGVWPRAQATLACLGVDEWPADQLRAAGQHRVRGRGRQRGRGRRRGADGHGPGAPARRT
jgi:hypothetical protein